MSRKNTVSIIFKNGQSGDYDICELQILFELFKGMSEVCDTSMDVGERIQFSEFTKEEFDLAMAFVHEKCQNHEHLMPPGISRLMGFLGPRFSLSSFATIADSAAQNGYLDLLIWSRSTREWSRSVSVECMDMLPRSGRRTLRMSQVDARE
jgi:hypothetical protein